MATSNPHDPPCECVGWRSDSLGAPAIHRVIIARRDDGSVTADKFCLACSGTGYADTIASLAAEMHACDVAVSGEPGFPASDREAGLRENVAGRAWPASATANWNEVRPGLGDRIKSCIERERAARAKTERPAEFTRTNGVDETVAPPNVAGVRDLAEILGMSADANEGAIAARARGEIERLRGIEKSAAAMISSPATDAHLASLDASLVADARTHEIAIPAVNVARALLAGLRVTLGFVAESKTLSNRYRLEHETRAGAGHREPDTALRADVQIEE